MFFSVCPQAFCCISLACWSPPWKLPYRRWIRRQRPGAAQSKWPSLDANTGYTNKYNKILAEPLRHRLKLPNCWSAIQNLVNKLPCIISSRNTHWGSWNASGQTGGNGMCYAILLGPLADPQCSFCEMEPQTLEQWLHIIDVSGSLTLGSSPHLKGAGSPRCIVSENMEFAFLFIMSTDKETTVVVIQESTISFAEWSSRTELTCNANKFDGWKTPKRRWTVLSRCTVGESITSSGSAVTAEES